MLVLTEWVEKLGNKRVSKFILGLVSWEESEALSLMELAMCEKKVTK